MSANHSTIKTGFVVEQPHGPLFHPVCYFFAQGLVAAITIHRTKSRSLSRLPVLGIVLWLAYLEFTSAVGEGSRGFGKSTVAAFSFLYTVQLVNILWINSISSLGSEAADIPSNGQVSRNSFSLVLRLVAFNFRGIRTPWKVKNVRPFSTYYPNRIPRSRVQFLTRQLVVFAFQYLVLDFVSTQTSKPSEEDRNRFIGPGSELTYLSNTREQWIFRFCFTIAGRWFINRCFLTALYNIFSIIGVASGIFAPEDYPPFMGSMWSSYTIRGYWG
jgi:hypothetical protein